MSDALVANVEDGITRASASVRRPWCLFVTLAFASVVLFVGGGPLLSAVNEKSRVIVYHAKVGAGASLTAAKSLPLRSSPPPPPSPTAAVTVTAAVAPPVQVATTTTTNAAVTATATATCGDGRCDAPVETIETCFADCPGASTPPTCGEELHSDPQGNAVVDGRGHHVKSAGACCDACAKHAEKNPKRPCNSWVFCYMPHCWSADNGNTHLFGECWLKWQTDPKHPLYGQRGKYTDEYMRRNRDKHLNGNYPTDKNSVEAMRPFGIVPGSRRNLTVPTHVSWIGGVMGVTVDHSVQWTTDADGTMRSNKGDTIVDYRPWESREQNLQRGVKPEQMKF